MALTPTILAPQARVLAVAEPPATVTIEADQARVLAAANIPAEYIDSPQARVLSVVSDPAEIRAVQARVLVVARGRIEEPNVRAWTFTLDGHDFYVLRLGEDETLLYDTHSKQWYVWGSDESDIWRAYTGCNWQGADHWAHTYGSNVIVGDDGNGALYFLDPEGSLDDDPVSGDALPHTFERIITGQVATRSRDAVPCFGVQLIGSIGEAVEASLTDVTLFTSDDEGHTYDEHDTITVANGDYDARAEWWSLGSFVAPGRLFKVRDFGALCRVDYLEMIDPPEKE